MAAIGRFFTHRFVVWGLFSLPAIPMVARLAADPTSASGLLHPSGEFAARFMIVAMMATPLHMLWPKAGWTRSLVRHRRALGVAAFGYAVLHNLLYLVDMETLRNVLAEFWALSIWTGWAALAIFVPLAITSTDGFQRRMARSWRLLHRGIYVAALCTLVHWIFIQSNLGAALVHFVPLAMLEIYRVVKSRAARRHLAAF